MIGMDPPRAARDLAEADRRLRRGAELVTPRSWRVMWYLILAGLGAIMDIPSSRWRGVLMLILGLAMLVTSVLTATRTRARPLPIPTGWRTWLLVGIIAFGSYAAMLAGGLGLRALNVPAPFTLSSLVLVIALSLLSRLGHRWGYVERVKRSQW